MTPKADWRRIGLWGIWDNKTVLKNPHKGWYLHYYDNGIDIYFDKENPFDLMEWFPGLNHVYLRLAWSYLEPEEGNYKWEILDEIMRFYWKHGIRATLRISTKETGGCGGRIEQIYATPKWVEDAGCHGEMVRMGDGPACYEPDYGDPVFLEKYGNFMKALGDRYDGMPFLEYVDIGSFGEWGECHTEGASNRVWPVEVMKEHIDIHTRAFKKTPIMANYDIVALRRTFDGTEEEIAAYLNRIGTGMRVDSGCIGFYHDRYGYDGVHTPELFEATWRKAPVDLELAHYVHVKNHPDAWLDGRVMLATVMNIHASYAGFHGYAKEFYGNHPEISEEMANLLGYWYFLRSVHLPESIRAGQRVPIGMIWENRGVAPCYHPYKLYVKLTEKATGKTTLLPIQEADNRNWLPGTPWEEIYSIRPPKDLTPGEYVFSVGLFEEQDTETPLPEGYEAPPTYPFPGQPIRLALKADLCGEDDGFYRICTLNITPYEKIPYEGVKEVDLLWKTFPDPQTSWMD